MMIESGRAMDYRWKLTDIEAMPKINKTVFSCFSCGGGSSMGYKLAGYDVIGNVEIDPEMMRLYQKNLNPKYPYLMDVREFEKIPDSELPKELFNLDILDGSPPCSTFSIAGKREKKWGSEFAFREGQAVQRLDTLFFDFISIGHKLKPKVIIAENVMGILHGKAKGYVTEILQAFDDAGYHVQIFALNAATMGVPQARERVFFVAFRKDLDYPKLKLKFHENPIPYAEIKSKIPGPKINGNSSRYTLWKNRKPSDVRMSNTAGRVLGKESYFNIAYLHENRVVNTITSSSGSRSIRYSSPHFMSDEEIILSQTFPQDYDFMNSKVLYVCGMSVPPLMMYRIADQINRQWLGRE